MKVLLVSATEGELKPTAAFLNAKSVPFQAGRYRRGSLEVHLFSSGVGLSAMAYAMGRALALEQYDLAIHTGIAGSLNPELTPGNVVEVVSERFADLGAEDADGGFLDAADIGLVKANEPPFQDGWLHNPEGGRYEFLPTARGISVNKVHGYDPSIKALKQRFRADVESMEGAAFFYACLLSGVPFLEIRAISNMVEARNRANWKIDEAVGSLNEVVQQMLRVFMELPT